MAVTMATMGEPFPSPFPPAQLKTHTATTTMNRPKRPLMKKNPSSNPKTLTTSKILTAPTIAIELYTLNLATAKVKRMGTRLSLWETEQSRVARKQREAGRRMRCRV